MLAIITGFPNSVLCQWVCNFFFFHFQLKDPFLKVRGTCSPCDLYQRYTLIPHTRTFAGESRAQVDCIVTPI